MSKANTFSYEKIFVKHTQTKGIHEAVMLIENTAGDFSFEKGYGGKNLHSPILLASITKLFTTASILKLCDQAKLNLNDKIIDILDKDLLSGLHVYKNQEHTDKLTIADCLFQVSGLPDAFVEGQDNWTSRVIKEDFSYTFEETLDKVKQLKPHFEPRKPGKAFYSDINFDILGQIITKASGLTLSKAYQQMIINPLGLTKTYLPENETESIPLVYYQEQLLSRPQFLVSSGASGGVISTTNELMIFTKAFFTGQLFNKQHFTQLSNYHPLQLDMTPISYGGGYMRLSLEGLTTLFRGKGELIGHSGTTGSFAFYHPQRELFFVGDLNQMANPSRSVRLAMALAIVKQ